MQVRDGLTVTPWQIIGYRADGRPIYAIAGGAPGDDDGDDDGDEFDTDGGDGDGSDDGDDDDADGDDDGDGDDGDDNSSSPPSAAPPRKAPPAKSAPKTRTDGTPLSKLERALRSERQLRRDTARRLSELERKNATDAEKVQLDANDAAAALYKPIAIKAAARAALLEAGVKGDPGRLIGLIHMDDLDVDRDGEVIGLEGEISTLQNEYPEFFKAAASDDGAGDGANGDGRRPPRKAPAGNVNGGNGRTKVEPKTSAEKLAFAAEGRL